MPIVSEEYREKKKAEILDSAMICFAEKGYHNTTIEDIVNQSKISKGAIYNYFTSKDEIYVGLMNDRTSKQFAKFAAAFAEMKSAEEKIRYIFQMYREAKNSIDNFHVQTDFMLHARKNEEIRSIVVDRYKNKYLKYFMDIINDGKANGEFSKTADSEKITGMIWALVDGIGLEYCVFGEEYPFIGMIEYAEEVILHLLKKS